MNCHSQIFANSPFLEPVRDSFRTGRADPVDARPRSARLRLLRSQHPREQGRRLHDLPRPGRSDAADVAGDSRCRWNGASTATATRSATSGRATRCFSVDYAAAAESGRARQAAGRRVSDSEAHELLDVPPMNDDRAGGWDSGPGRAGRTEPARPAFWRTLDELADDPAFQRAPVQRVPVAGRSDHRSGRAPHVPEADGRVAGAGGRHRLHAPAGGEDRSLRPPARRARSRASRSSTRPR